MVSPLTLKRPRADSFEVCTSPSLRCAASPSGAKQAKRGATPEQSRDWMCHYERLGASRTDPKEKIRFKYRQVALECHPDKNPDRREDATEIFKAVGEAYFVLSDPKRRALYDEYGRDWAEKSEDDFEFDLIDAMKQFWSLAEKWLARVHGVVETIWRAFLLNEAHDGSHSVPPQDFGEPIGLVDKQDTKVDDKCPTEANVADIAMALARCATFGHLDPMELRMVAAAMRLVCTKGGVDIVQQGTDGFLFYIVHKGRVEVMQDGQSLGTLLAGDAFGERALLTSGRRTATVRATTDVELWTLQKGVFLAVLRRAALLAEGSRSMQGLHRRVPLLAELPDAELRSMTAMFTPQLFQEGDTIVNEGDDADGGAFYVIEEGEVRVSRGEVALPVLGPGGYFGEVALLKGTPRAATVVALSKEVCCLCLTKQQFESSVSCRLRALLEQRLDAYGLPSAQ